MRDVAYPANLHLGIRALPREKSRARDQIREAFSKIGSDFSSTLTEAMNAALEQQIEPLRSAISPKLKTIKAKENNLQDLISQGEDLKSDVNQLISLIEARYGQSQDRSAVA